MQYKTGKVWVANGSNTVYGTDGTGGTTDVAWENATITPGLTMLTISDNGTQTIYTITAVDTVNNTLTISEAYKEDTILEANAKSYGIHTDFTPSFNLPVMAPGDINVASILARFAVKVDQELSAIAGAGANNGAAVDYAISVTGTIVVGTVIAWDVTNGGFKPAYTGSTDLDFPVGIIVSLSPVTMRVAGKITGIDAGFSLSAGTTYYLNSTQNSGFNLDSNPSSPKIAILKATGSTEGFLVLTPRLSSFTTTDEGLVPAPGSITGKVLSDNGDWVTAPVSDVDKDDMYLGDNSYKFADTLFPMYDSAAVFPVNSATLDKAGYIAASDQWFSQVALGTAGNQYKSLYQMILELHRRVKVLSDFSVSMVEKLFTFETGDAISDYANPAYSTDPRYTYQGLPFTLKTFSVPSSVKSLTIEMWSASGRIYSTRTAKIMIPPGGTYARFQLDVEAEGIDDITMLIGLYSGHPAVAHYNSPLGGSTRVYKSTNISVETNLLATAWGGVPNTDAYGQGTNPLPEMFNSPTLVAGTEFLAARTGPGPYGIATEADLYSPREFVHGAVKITYII